MSFESRVNSQFISHEWLSTSRWSAKELHLLHVDNILTDDILDTEFTVISSRLDRVLKALPCDLKDMPTDSFEFAESYGMSTLTFYEALSAVCHSVSRTMEQDSFLNTETETLLDYVTTVGSAMPISEGSSSQGSTTAVVGSPIESRNRVRFENESATGSSVAHSMSLRPRTDETRSVTSAVIPMSMPKSTSGELMLSNQSLEMAASEAETEDTLRCFMRILLFQMRTKTLKLRVKHSAYTVMLGTHDGVASQNDGAIIMGDAVLKGNNIPLINFECKSRAGVTGAEVMGKVFSQEFGEMLAIVQKRLSQSMNFPRSPSVYTVFTIAMHGRRAYLAKAVFPPDYLQGILEQNLGKERVTVYRTRQSYRLDLKEDLHAFATLIVRLLSGLEMEVEAGRRF